MKRNKTRSILPIMLWTKLAADMTSMLMASNEVIARRMHMISKVGASPTPAERKELHRMSSEKIAATMESASAMTNGTAMACMDAWLAMFRPAGFAGTAAALNSASTAGARILAKGLSPIHRRAASNAKRLRNK